MGKLLGDQAADQIIQLIIDNDGKAGDKMPNEYELAEQLNVSRSTVREAIKALVSRNILEIKRGSGTFISEKCGISDDPLGLMFVKNKLKLATDLLEIRFMIEPKIASLAAANATDEEIREIEVLCDKVEQLILNNQPHMDVDIEFHGAIARSSKNIVIANLIPIINKSISLCIDVTDRQIAKETIETHKEVLNCIKSRDINGAYDAMYLHLVYNRRNIKKLIEIKNNETHLDI